MAKIWRLSLIVLVTLAGLWSSTTTSVAESAENRRILREAKNEFNAGLELYREGRYREGLERMERALVVYQGAEDANIAVLSGASSEEPTEKESSARSWALLLSPASGGRRKLLDIHLAHGCYERAAVLAETELRWWKLAVPDIESDPSQFDAGHGKTFFRSLHLLYAAARGAGQLERAITLQNEILDYLKRLQSVRDMRMSHAFGLLELAFLHQEAGNNEAKERLLAEARGAIDELWREKAPSETSRLATNAINMQLEGRDEEALALLKRRLEIKEEHFPSLATEALRLSKAYGRLGRNVDAVETLEPVLKRLVDSPSHSFVPKEKVAYFLAKYLMKTGDEQAAQRLINEFQLCL